MPAALVEPLGATVEILPGEALMEAAERQGLDWPTVCGGDGTCGTCYVTVLEGADALPEASEWERDGLSLLPASVLDGPQPARLACQLRPTADLVVHKPGVRAA